VTLWQTVIYFVYKLSLNCRSFQAIAGCPPDSSSSRTAHQHTQRAAQETHCGPTLSRFHQKRPMASKFAECKLGGLSRVVCNVGAYRKLKRKPKTIAELKESLLEQPTTRTDRQDCERLLKLSDWRLVLELGAWSCRWTVQTFTVTMKFWHLIIS